MNKFAQLVVNGCSYSQGYADGNGHRDLANRLGIASAKSLAMGGSANSRILRTTLKHSYQTTKPTLYILGMTFVSRGEIPIVKVIDETISFEGRWANPQNLKYSSTWDHFWTTKKTEEFIDMKLMTEAYSLIDRTEDLMYRMLAVISNLHARGHQVVMYQQADQSYDYYIDYDRLQFFKNNPNIIDGFKWRAIEYQHLMGVEKTPPGGGNFIGPEHVPDNMRHPRSGHHQVVNDYLEQYIINNKLLE
jgi:hypothetical protein